ncbi:protein phosphatase 2C domain-containing protein [Streptomyces avidinii]|uniref:protein phosphatase 2C domain-containing protein n=1 Tax=Streptomyces avidinii TaxID=1895 RepID=UPI00386CDA7E|nr:protein phosphatase 2C domain-containing protein [Streptomyces avidinii]
MSQQGADDWWQKLYEGPDAGAEPDPGDTLDNRFRSAAGVTTEPAPNRGQTLGHGPGQGAGQGPGQDPTRASAQSQGLGPASGQGQVPAQDLGRSPAQDLGRFPEQGLGPAPDPGLPEPPRAPEPARPPEPLVPGPRQGDAEPGPAPAPAPTRTPTLPTLPPPRDPRAGDATGYALGGVAVPPVPVQEPELPVRRPESPRTEPRFDPKRPPAAPDPAPGAAPVPAVPVPAAAGPAAARPEVSHLGDRAPTYAPEPGALPPADPAALDGLTPDTVLEGARYGSYTLRAASLRGDSARYRGEARRDFLLTARFGSGDDALVLVALAGGDRAAPGAAEAAAELCRSVAAAVGRSQDRLAEDIRAGRRDDLRSGLQRLTDRGYGRLRARAAELGLAETAYTAGLRGLLLPVDPQCRTRVCFGAGAGGLFRLRSGEWQDLEPDGQPEDTEGGFCFRASVARPGDTLLLCSGGLADPMREEAALSAELAARWSEQEPPGLAAFLADTQLRLKGYADDRTAAAVWEA